MKKNITTLFMAFIVLSMYAQAQTIFPAPGYVTWCPDQNYFYEVRDAQTACKYAWSVTNGKIIDGLGTSKVTVKWNDIAGTGKLTVALSVCEGADDKNITTLTEDYAIRSLAGRVPASPRVNKTLPYCVTESLHLAVNVMFLDNTGGSDGIPQQRADGYEWVLPAGWKSNGSSGTVSTIQEFITINPDNGCSTGSVTVKAYINSCGTKKYSASASISVGKQPISINIAPPAGFTGSTCGSNTPVTFTVTPVECAKDYKWTFSGPDAQTPSGWETTPVSTTTNYINVAPTGTPADAGSLKVTITLDCGTQLVSNTYALVLKTPTISSIQSLCSGGSTVSLLNVSSNAGINWQTSPNIVIASGQGTLNTVMSAISSTTRDYGTITALITNCPTASRNVWVGKPWIAGTLIGGSSTTDNYLAYSPLINKICNLNTFTTNMDIRGESSLLWERIAANPTNTTWRKAGDNISGYFLKVAQTATFRLTTVNSCGTITNDYNFKSISCSSGGGGGGDCDRYSVSPNPASTELNIVAPSIPSPCLNPPVASKSESDTEQNLVTQLTIRIANLYNTNEQLVRSQQFNDVKNATFNLNGLPKGVYVLRISNGSYLETHRISIN